MALDCARREHFLAEGAGRGETVAVALARVVAVVDQRGLPRVGAEDADLPFRLLAGEVGPQAGDVFLLVDRERVRLPLRLAVGIGRPAHVGGEEAAGGDAEALPPEDHGEAGMIEQIAADRKIGRHRNAQRPQPVGRTDARALQDRPDCCIPRR